MPQVIVAPTAPEEAAPAERRRRVRIGDVWMDALTLDETLDAVAALVRAGQGGSLFTPNVDHLIMASEDARFRAAYAEASLALVDGMPVLWASRLLGTPLPEKVSGSDLVLPLVRRAAREGWRVYLVGGAPGVAESAGRVFAERYGVQVVGCDAPMLSRAGESADEDAVHERIRRARPDLVFVAFGAPKQEFWIERARGALGGAVAVTVGASLSMVNGDLRRAPRWMSRVGLEWVYRLASEPRRLWHRYLVRGPRFLSIVASTARAPRASRATRV
jgi:N-acetylglucosaminyldiphosphoundecaprenol N-acetyl-beta-D-mannosaminyltransferase